MQKHIDLTERTQAWQTFFATHKWHELIRKYKPRKSGCGLVYELPNYLQDPSEGCAIVDMRSIAFTEPHYHPEIEIFFVLQGNAQIVIGNELHAVKQGELLEVPSNIAHFVLPDSECVLGVINTPPFDPKSYVVLHASNESVCFDHELFKQLTDPIAIKQIDVSHKSHIAHARSIFISYFADLYKDIPADTLGISDVQKHLNTIFEKTETALHQKDLFAFLAYINNTPVGLATCGPLEDNHTILLRTLPVSLSHIHRTTQIRAALLDHIKHTFPQATRVVMMVRPANKSYASFCLNAGFTKNDNMFEESKYIKDVYDARWYTPYVYQTNKDKS